MSAPAVGLACTWTGEHGPHYLGRDERGVPQRCAGWTDPHPDAWAEGAWTGL